jgi:hypothetical protein
MLAASGLVILLVYKECKERKALLGYKALTVLMVLKV